MPEYFEITFIVEKNKQQENVIKKHFLENLKLKEGRNLIEESNYSMLAHREILFCFYDWDDIDFNVFFISFPDQIFHKEYFEKELGQLTHIAANCFKASESIVLAVCSYEININIIDTVKKIKDMDAQFLSKFPIEYIRQPNTGAALPLVNFEAQDIFTLDPIKPL